MSNNESMLIAIRKARDEEELRGLIDDLISLRKDDQHTVSLFIMNMMIILRGLRAEEIPLSEFANVVAAIRIFREHRQELKNDPLSTMDF